MAFEAIVKQCHENGVEEVIAAGDSFDGPVQDPSFIDYCADTYLPLTLVPGNHDPGLRQGFFASKRVTVVEKPLLREGKIPLLFLPYREESTMGMAIEAAGLRESLAQRAWILVSHGDFGRYAPDEKGREQGYFPLTRRDLQRCNPALTILGHIHRGHEAAPGIHYPGSPVPLDITERGPRRYLLVNRETLGVKSVSVPGAPVNEILDIICVPGSDEARGVYDRVISQVQSIRSGMGTEGAVPLTLRVHVRGRAEERGDVEEAVKKACSEEGVSLEGIHLGELLPAGETRTGEIARLVQEKIHEYKLSYRPDEITEDEVMKRALNILYK